MKTDVFRQHLDIAADKVEEAINFKTTLLETELQEFSRKKLVIQT